MRSVYLLEALEPRQLDIGPNLSSRSRIECFHVAEPPWMIGEPDPFKLSNATAEKADDAEFGANRQE